MSESSEQKSNGLPIPALASILLMLVGVLAPHLNSLDSPRPTIPDKINAQYVNIEDVDARLWQDPFTAILRHNPTNKSETNTNEADICFDISPKSKDKCFSKHSVDAFIQVIADMSNNQKQAVTVLGVMVSGGDYVENIEDRRRTRYAVLSGLAVKGYAPKDHEHIGYVEDIEDIEGIKRTEKDEYIKFMPKKIPFEWFKADDDTPSAPVLVLWLDDTVFSSISEPLKTTQSFVTLMKNAVNIKKKVEKDAVKKKVKNPITPVNLEFKFIGPASSNTLQVMLDELDTNYHYLKDKKPITQKYDFKYYNAMATGDWPGMKIPPTWNNSEEWGYQQKSIQRYLESLNLASLFTRTSLTDYDIAKELFIELQRRGLEILPSSSNHFQSDNKDHVVIISEWDTIYGRRGLPDAMKHQLVKMESYCSKENIRENKCEQPNINWIHPFSYMRGLDGIIPGDEKNTEKSKKEKDSDAEIDLERSEGQNQQDYLRRLAVRIDTLKQKLENNKQKIKAIGVLGSDAYDKLMVLKALKPYFPDVIFFTTDLDMRLMHPKEFDFTRNLVVASSFDLQLAENLQKTIPPFRDSYQTANFFAIQIALDAANGKPVNQQEIQQNINDMLGTARLFETASNQAIPLNYSNINSNRKGNDCEKLQGCLNAHPKPLAQNFKPSLIVAGVALALWIMVAVHFFMRNHRYFTTSLTLKWILWTLILVSVLGAGVMIWTCYASFQIIQSIPLDNAYLSIMRPVIFILTLVSWTLPIFYFGSKYYLRINDIAIQKNLQWWLIGFLLLWTLVITWLSYQSLSIIESEIGLGEDGEPFFLNAGISLWPSELIRLFAGILSCLFIVDAIIAVLHNNQNLKEYFKLSTPHPKDVAELWQDHCSAKNLYWCGGSIAVLSIVFLCLGFSIIDSPFVPYRGGISFKANTLVLNCFSVPLFVVLLMTVFVITLHGVIMIKQLNVLRTTPTSKKPNLPIFYLGLHSVWPPKALYSYSLLFESHKWKTLRKTLENNNKYHLDAWLDIQFIAAYTKVVGRLVYYPFIILALMIFARSKIFDNWNMPIGLAIVLLITTALTLFSAFYLRIVTEQVREDVITHIANMKISLSGLLDENKDDCSAMEKQIDLIITKIQGMNEGAFQPLTHAPAFQALLLPFGGMGGVMLLENLLLNGFL
ncbi:MAG: hypothetical protein NTW85_07405 [Methylococcales bacterium]|nr:hypothetical protein [Methylococcales bacterium]